MHYKKYSIKKICLITSGHLATNPRLLKEVDALLKAGYHVHVIFTQYMNYLLADDAKLLKTRPSLIYNKLVWSREYSLVKITSGIKQKFIIWLSRYFSSIKAFSEIILNRNYSWQLRKAVSAKADLYIAHNLGALPVAVNAAKKNNAKCGFDAEDFHRQEVTDNTNSKDYQLAKFIEEKYFPKLNYLTTASPLIADEYNKLYPKLNPFIINNVFSNKFVNVTVIQNERKTLKLFWFSQTIGKNRGLETVIQAIGLLNNPNITLTLLGMLSTIDEIYFRNFATEEGLILNQLIFLSPVAPDNIFSIASQYDIGLALELNTPLNRDICLTNKIFTYLSAGLAIIASETAAQNQFLNNYPLVGKSFPIGDINALAKIIELYIQNPNVLLSTKIAATQLAKNELNWEYESHKFLNIVKKIV